MKANLEDSMMASFNPNTQSVLSYAQATNNLVKASGTTFAYRELGPHGGIPLVLLNHWGAVLGQR